MGDPGVVVDALAQSLSLRMLGDGRLLACRSRSAIA